MTITKQFRKSEVDANTAAKMLQVSRMQVCRYLEDGTLSGYRTSKKGWWRVYVSSIEAIINERKFSQ